MLGAENGVVIDRVDSKTVTGHSLRVRSCVVYQVCTEQSVATVSKRKLGVSVLSKWPMNPEAAQQHMLEGVVTWLIAYSTVHQVSLEGCLVL
jgi:hypothetical protein